MRGMIASNKAFSVFVRSIIPLIFLCGSAPGNGCGGTSPVGWKAWQWTISPVRRRATTRVPVAVVGSRVAPAEPVAPDRAASREVAGRRTPRNARPVRVRTIAALVRVKTGGVIRMVIGRTAVTKRAGTTGEVRKDGLTAAIAPSVMSVPSVMTGAGTTECMPIVLGMTGLGAMTGRAMIGHGVATAPVVAGGHGTSVVTTARVTTARIGRIGRTDRTATTVRVGKIGLTGTTARVRAVGTGATVPSSRIGLGVNVPSVPSVRTEPMARQVPIAVPETTALTVVIGPGAMSGRVVTGSLTGTAARVVLTGSEARNRFVRNTATIGRAGVTAVRIAGTEPKELAPTSGIGTAPATGRVRRGRSVTTAGGTTAGVTNETGIVVRTGMPGHPAATARTGLVTEMADRGRTVVATAVSVAVTATRVLAPRSVGSAHPGLRIVARTGPGGPTGRGSGTVAISPGPRAGRPASRTSCRPARSRLRRA
jgi:hypothetical protein